MGEIAGVVVVLPPGLVMGNAKVEDGDGPGGVDMPADGDGGVEGVDVELADGVAIGVGVGVGGMIFSQ